MIIGLLCLWAMVGAASHVTIEVLSQRRNKQPFWFSVVAGPFELLDLYKTYVQPKLPTQNGIVGIKPVCAKCKLELEVYGGLAFSPPVEDKTVKYHLCVSCWDKFVKWTKRK